MSFAALSTSRSTENSTVMFERSSTLRDVIFGVLPFVGLMIVAVVLICVFPAIATGFPNLVMGAPTK
jgi:TRAP-type mannitol/chloroaromatic compound transport system permease large subunit